MFRLAEREAEGRHPRHVPKSDPAAADDGGEVLVGNTLAARTPSRGGVTYAADP
jgi:hypothetical protein